jgi:hypothetical protein
MQNDLTQISSSVLVDMLIRDTEYYKILVSVNADSAQKKLVNDHINLILVEMKSREGYREVLNDERSIPSPRY